MKWKKLSDYAIQSGPYTISKSLLKGSARYTLWIGEQPGRMVGIRKTLDEAKSMTEKEVESV